MVISALKQATVHPGCNFSLKQWGTSRQIKKTITGPNATGSHKEMEKEFKTSGEKVVSLSQFYV